MEFQTQMRLAANLRQLRVSSGLSQSELARRLQADRSMLALYESGRRNPDLETVYKLSKMYGLRMETMLECDPVNILGEVTYRKVCEDGEKNLVWTFRKLSLFSKGRLLEKAEDLAALDAGFGSMQEKRMEQAMR